MNNRMLRLAVVAVGVVAAAACTKKDSNSITGSTDYTSVAAVVRSAVSTSRSLVAQKIDTSSRRA